MTSTLEQLLEAVWTLDAWFYIVSPLVFRVDDVVRVVRIKN